MKNLKNFAATVAMLLCCITASAYDFEVESLGYTITSADELTVSVAQGATAPIGDLVIPSTVTNAEVTYSVTAIAASAFSGCSELTSITIPASVTTIGSSAFSGCTAIKELTFEDGTEALSLATKQFSSCPLEKIYLGRDLDYSTSYLSDAPFYKQIALTSVIIGEKVTTIGESVFGGCSSLTSLTIPASVTTIGDFAFRDCGGLTSLTIGDAVTTIGSNAFYGCSGLTSMTIPASVTTIASSAFSGCCGLTSLALGDAVTTIGSSAFSGCSGLTSITIPASVTTIASSAFSGCSGLTSMTIPASVTTIGSKAFYGCSGIKELILEDGTEILTLEGSSSMFSSCPLEKIYLGRDLTYGTTNSYAPFYDQDALTSVIIGEKVTTIGSSAFYGCSSLTSMTIPANITTIGFDAFSSCSGIKELILEDGTEILTLESSSSYSMFYNSPLEKVYLGRNLSYNTSNSSNAPFYEKTALTSVTIGSQVTSIGSNAFYGCSKLSEVNVKSIESWLNINFENSYSNPVFYSKGFYIDGKLVTDIVVPSTVTEVKDYAFNTNKALLSVDLGDAVTTIGRSAFGGCSGLTSITIPASVTTIGDYAFSSCSGLTSITIPASVTTIGDYAFSSCSGLTSLTLGDAVTTIGAHAFNGCSGLTSLILGDAVTTIGAYAFNGCSRLASLTLGDAVTTIGALAFNNCLNLKDLYIANLDAWAAIEYGDQYSHPNYYATNIYHNDKLVTEVEIPTTITTIPDYTFYNFGDVVKVKLHEGVESIGQRAFLSVAAVFEVAATTVPTLGTSAISAPSVVVVPQEAGTAYSEADGWANLIITTNDVYEQTLTLEAAEDASSLHKTLGDAKLDSVVNLTISGTINSYDFMVMRTKMTKLRNLDLTDAIIKYNAYEHYSGFHTTDSVMPGYAFYKCNLFGLKFPKAIKSIGSYANYENRYLRDVQFTGSLEGGIGDYAFYRNSLLRNIVLPDGMISIGRSSFQRCASLSEISFPKSLESIGWYAFASYDTNKEILPIEELDFSHCNLKSIGTYAFSYCTRLIEIKLPERTLQTIDEGAFRYCYSLEELRIPSSVRTIGDNAFTACTKLEKVYVYTVEPISIGQNTFALTGNNFVGALYAPRVSYYTYWYDTQWGQFQSINEFDEPYEYAYFEGDTTLDPSTGTVDGDGETLPDADMGSQSGNTVNGAEATEEEEEEGGETPAAANSMRRTQAATATTLTQEWGTLNVAHNGTDGASIIAKNGGAVTAETANFRINVTGGKWYFLSFPFDIKKENIKCEGGANYVFRYYDGAVRAANGSGGWTNVAVADDGTYLKAGKGYIFQASKSDVLVLTVEDMSIVSEDKNTAVEAYAADNTANASWNFVGNPYLSYYNVTAADYSAPITVWNGSSYQAVRPGDDEYQLAPFEAFFVQKPEGVNGITYATTSQTTYQKIQAAAAAAPGRRTAEINPDRLLVNIALTDGTTADQTRVVFNNAVSMDYEMECDAAKFSTAGVPQLYTIDSRAVKYAINERPVAEGVVTMGFTAPAQGVYTLSAPRMDTPMLLRDNATGTTHDFAEGSYDFASEAGTFDDRFTLMMKAGETTSIDNSQWTIDDEAPVYNTKGQRVNEATEQGIYIKGNRKVVTL